MFYFVVVVIEGAKGVAILFVVPTDVQKNVVMGLIVMNAIGLIMNHSLLKMPDSMEGQGWRRGSPSGKPQGWWD